MYYEHLMQQIPNYDKRPREIKDDSCLICPGYNLKIGKCRFCECQYENNTSDHKSEVIFEEERKET